MKKILIVNASKRRNGNSYTLEKRLAEQLAGKAEVSTFRIGEKDVRVCLAGDANVPGSIMDKPDDLKAADEMAAWLLA